MAVPLADKPGTLADLCSVLGRAQVNIITIHAPEARGRGKVRVLVVDLPGARAALKEAKVRFSEEEALDVELDNRPGAFAELASKFAAARINIRYAYATTTSFGRAKVVIGVPDPAKALKVVGA